MQLPDWAATWIGLPYKVRGRDLSLGGLDCWGFAALLTKRQFGKEVPLWEGVGFTDTTDMFQSRKIAKELALFMANHEDPWLAISPEKREVGDWILLRAIGFPIHVGVYVGGEWFLHIEHKTSSCASRLDSIEWRNRVIGYYRYVG